MARIVHPPRGSKQKRGLWRFNWALAAGLFLLGACSGAKSTNQIPTTTSQILLTSETGAKLASQPNVQFREGDASGVIITIFPDSLKQTIEGIGSSFTESSAFVLAHLEPALRREVMEKIYGESGANFTLTRTHLASCDFSVEGRYSYAEVADDARLDAFSIAPDLAGFDPATYGGIKEPGYDLIPMIEEALAIKDRQEDRELRIIASAWTAPPWMKDTGAWYTPGSAANNWQGHGGSLKPEYVATYADYIIKYLDAYHERGIDIWGVTPVNEPHGNGGQWESMDFTPESQRDFVREHLGPRLRQSQHQATRLLIYDQNRDGLEHWADVVLGDPETAAYVDGTAIHWYASTFKVFEDVLDRVHTKFPEYSLIHTEGCIDNLGNAASAGIEDPVGYQESNWFGNDAFWWNKTATDWAYTAQWAGESVADHPMYVPVHRYARNMIVSLDHWVGGWVDWNIVLDRAGGPNHVGNFCGAPIMIDTVNQDVYYTPVYYVLAQFSRTIRPGDRAVQTERSLAGLDPDALHACATLNAGGLLSVQLLNTTPQTIPSSLQIDGRYAEIVIPANSLLTVRVPLTP